MRQRGTFVHGIVAAVSARILRQHVIIHQHGKCLLIFKTLFPVKNDNQIHVADSSKTLHYNSIWSLDGNRFHIDKTECIFYLNINLPQN